MIVDCTLIDFRYNTHYKADRGKHGQGSSMHGSDAEDKVLRVPVGTVVRDAETTQILADLTSAPALSAVTQQTEPCSITVSMPINKSIQILCDNGLLIFCLRFFIKHLQKLPVKRSQIFTYKRI